MASVEARGKGANGGGCLHFVSKFCCAIGHACVPQCVLAFECVDHDLRDEKPGGRLRARSAALRRYWREFRNYPGPV